ncbi:MAG: cation transporter [Coriobacteriales bacterium]|jgi:copper chaperone|nr:cation transporter [Coriobacteriales bacterium]
MSEKVVIKVEGMSCGHCTAAVEAALTELPDVTSASADLDSGNVTILHNGSVAPEAIQDAIEEAGFALG